MPKQRNVVDPFGNIHHLSYASDNKDSEFYRTVMGNRGPLNSSNRHGPPERYYSHSNWVFCRMDFGPPSLSNPRLKYTILFFLDEATALAAGHRPCGECSRARYTLFIELWGQVNPDLKMDKTLQEQRVIAGRPKRHTKVTRPAPIDNLPFGTFIAQGNSQTPYLVRDDALWPWTLSGYSQPIARPRGETVTVLTPPATVKVLAAGYRPQIYPDPYFDPERWSHPLNN